VASICFSSTFCDGVNKTPPSVVSSLRLGANLSSIAVPPLWPVLPICKEKCGDLAAFRDGVACALENELIGTHHTHGFRLTVNHRVLLVRCGDGADIVPLDREFPREVGLRTELNANRLGSSDQERLFP
jgi:hypothetical protein